MLRRRRAPGRLQKLDAVAAGDAPPAPAAQRGEPARERGGGILPVIFAMTRNSNLREGEPQIARQHDSSPERRTSPTRARTENPPSSPERPASFTPSRAARPRRRPSCPPDPLPCKRLTPAGDTMQNGTVTAGWLASHKWAWKPCRDRSRTSHEACGRPNNTVPAMIFFRNQCRLVTLLLRRQGSPKDEACLGRPSLAAARAGGSPRSSSASRLQRGRTPPGARRSRDRQQADACRMTARTEHLRHQLTTGRRPSARPHALNIEPPANDKLSARCRGRPRPPAMAGMSEPSTSSPA